MKRWLAFLFCTLFLIVGVGVGVLHLDQFANNPKVMVARNWYQNTYISVMGKLGDERGVAPSYRLPYTIQVQPWMDIYVYTLYGRLIEVDTESRVIVVRGDDGREYRIKPSKWLMRDLGLDHETGETVVPGQEYLQLDILPVQAGDRIRVMWDESRTLRELKKIHEEEPEKPINDGFLRFFFFTHQNK